MVATIKELENLSLLQKLSSFFLKSFCHTFFYKFEIFAKELEPLEQPDILHEVLKGISFNDPRSSVSITQRKNQTFQHSGNQKNQFYKYFIVFFIISSF